MRVRILPPVIMAVGALVIGLASPLPARAQAADLVVRESKLGVKDTIDALAAAVEKAGAKVVARVDHAAAAKAVGMDLKPTEVLIFGNPKLGTPLMQASPQIALDLPLKVAAYTDASGRVMVAYTKPDALKARYGVAGKDEAFAAMAAALDKLTGAATGAAK